MNLTSIARPYAKAAFEAAKSANQILLWSLALKQLAFTADHTDVKSILKNPNDTKEKLSELFIDVLHKSLGNGSANNFLPLDNFIHLLAEKKRLNLLPDIAHLFEEKSAAESGLIALTITTAYTMNDEQRNQLIERLIKQLHSKIKADFFVDEQLTSGLLIRSENWVWDGSVRGTLGRLRTVLG